MLTTQMTCRHTKLYVIFNTQDFRKDFTMYLTIAVRTIVKDETTARELFKSVKEKLSDIPEITVSGSVSTTIDNES